MKPCWSHGLTLQHVRTIEYQSCFVLAAFEANLELISMWKRTTRSHSITITITTRTQSRSCIFLVSSWELRSWRDQLVAIVFAMNVLSKTPYASLIDYLSLPIHISSQSSDMFVAKRSLGSSMVHLAVDKWEVVASSHRGTWLFVVNSPNSGLEGVSMGSPSRCEAGQCDLPTCIGTCWAFSW